MKLKLPNDYLFVHVHRTLVRLQRFDKIRMQSIKIDLFHVLFIDFISFSPFQFPVLRVSILNQTHDGTGATECRRENR